MAEITSKNASKYVVTITSLTATTISAINMYVLIVDPNSQIFDLLSGSKNV